VTKLAEFHCTAQHPGLMLAECVTVIRILLSMHLYRPAVRLLPDTNLGVVCGIHVVFVGDLVAFVGILVAFVGILVAFVGILVVIGILAVVVVAVVADHILFHVMSCELSP
jgi:hypothetical protein